MLFLLHFWDTFSKIPDIRLNMKKFTEISLNEDKNPLFDDFKEGADSRVGKKMSLNKIVEQLQNNGDNGFSESTIYKMSKSKQMKQEFEEKGKKLTEYVMVEATLNVFMDQAAVTIYLRDVTHYVNVQKFCQQTIQQEIKAEAEEEIVDALA